MRNLASSCLLDIRGLRVTQNAFFSILTHTKQLLLLTFCDTTAGIVKGCHAGTVRCYQTLHIGRRE